MSLNSSSFASKLDRLAELSVKTGVNISNGQELIISAPLESVDLVRRITEHAYQAGASLVTTLYTDETSKKARFLHAHGQTFDYASAWLAEGLTRAFEAGAARLAITGEDPALLSGLDPEKIARANKASSMVNRASMQLITDFAINWSIVAYATPSWARTVFPDIPEQTAVEKLWEAIFKASRVTEHNPVAAWQKHNETLHQRASWLNNARFTALHFTGPGTDLRVGLADGHLWAGGAEQARNGVICNPNIPTEEVFTTPHRLRVDGYVCSTKPLSCQGTLIKDIQARFENGRVSELHAGQGQAMLEKILSSDEGARHLGEVALVPHSSPVSQSGILFQNTLFDENAASHLAFGQAYSKCMLEPRQADMAVRGANSSIIHIDWMIGSPHINVDGMYVERAPVPLMRNGEWIAC